MEYRMLGNTGLTVGALSLGTEYLIDLSFNQAREVIEKAFQAGVNYYDVFWAKPEFRDMMGKIFAPFRDKIHLAAHLGAAHIDGQYKVVRDRKTAITFFEDFLNRYNTDYTDILFLHCCDTREDFDTVMAPGGLKDLALEYKKEGKARCIGFSGHTPETALQAVQHEAVEVLMYPINPAGSGSTKRAALFAECARRNVGLVGMKPFAAGKLLTPGAADSLDTYVTGTGDRRLEKESFLTPVQGIHYALTQPGVSTIVPGCGTVRELEEDISYFAASEEEKDFSSIIGSIGLYEKGECVYCNHCLPCPVRINIGTVIRLHEKAVRYAAPDSARSAYKELEVKADTCTECGSCEDRCPFGVPTVEKIRRAAEYFEGY